MHGGWGTDRNDATTGSICDIMLGADKLPKKWAGVLNGHLSSMARGFSEYRVSDLAKCSHEIAGELIAGAR